MIFVIFSKIDDYSVVLHGFSLVQVFEKLDISSEDLISYLQSSFQSDATSVGVVKQWSASFYGISIQIPLKDFTVVSQVVSDESQFCHTPFPYIRLHLHGSGLDFLRYLEVTLNHSFDPDRDLCRIDFWSADRQAWNVTRCDFAFDFVNMFDGFLTYLHSDIRKLEDTGYLNRDRQCLKVLGHRAISYDLRFSNFSKCFYFGSAGSERFLRIYDKKLELSARGVFDERAVPDVFTKNGIDQVDSWFRIELQCRRDQAESLLFATYVKDESFLLDFSWVLRFIFDYYALLGDDNEILPSLKLITDFIPYDSVIPYNSCYVEKADIVVRSTNYLDRNMKAITCAICAHGGIDGFIEYLEAFWTRLYCSKDPVDVFRFSSMLLSTNLIAKQFDNSLPFVLLDHKFKFVRKR